MQVRLAAPQDVNVTLLRAEGLVPGLHKQDLCKYGLRPLWIRLDQCDWGRVNDLAATDEFSPRSSLTRFVANA